MLVGVLISIMISIVVGVNLIPTIITSINTARTEADAVEGFSGLGGLMEVLALGRNSAFMKRFIKQTSRIRGSLSTWVYGNPELSRFFKKNWACVETRREASLKDDGIVLAHRKMGVQDVYIAVKYRIAAFESNLNAKSTQIRGRLNTFVYANPEPSLLIGRCRDLTGCPSNEGEEKVQSFVKAKSNCILLGAVAWIKFGSLIQQCISVIPLIRGSLNQLWHGNPELASFLGRRASVETIYGTSLAG